LTAVDAFTERCRTLADAWGWWATALPAVGEEAWRTDTRLPGWDVAELVAHATLLVRGLGYLATHPVDAEPVVGSARDMLRGFNAPGGVATTSAHGVAELARRQAASMSTDQLVALFAETAPEVIAKIRGAGPIVVEYFGNGTFPIGEAMSIAVLEAVVHGLDLCAATGIAGSSIPPAALAHTVQLLASMAEPVTFIEAATGRTAVDVLPLLR
jgi:uncharacterized protein (TIGR03083 family)